MSNNPTTADCIGKEHIMQAIDVLGLAGADVCIHSSLKSFGVQIEGGAQGILEAFLEKGCTVLVPTFTYDHEAVPARECIPARNGMEDYETLLKNETVPHKHFTVDSTEISAWDMGAFPKNLLHHPQHLRGNNALNSFAAVGPHAEELLREQTHRDVYASFRKLVEHNGYVLMMGVGLHSMTLIHQAELLSGRNPFIRWAYDENDKPFPVATGSCSEAFEVFADALRPFKQEITVAHSRWMCFKASDVLDTCVPLIRENQSITNCGDPNCTRCPDAVLGGPILPEDFWENA